MPKYLHVERKGQYAILTIAREPVNSMNLDVWLELSAALDELENDKAVRGLIITSGLKKNVFTAGNDINELYAPSTSKARYTKFWAVSNGFLARLYNSPLVTIAAIRGACPAGGCVTVMCCDYRIMTSEQQVPGSVIGLNEVALGIPVPKHWIEVMTRLAGWNVTHNLLMTGQQPPATQALKLGLIDQIAEVDNLLAAAEKEMQIRLKFADDGRVPTKQTMRSALSAEWSQLSEEEANAAWTRLSSPKVVKSLEAVLARLSGNKSKKQPSKL